LRYNILQYSFEIIIINNKIDVPIYINLLNLKIVIYQNPQVINYLILLAINICDRCYYILLYYRNYRKIIKKILIYILKQQISDFVHIASYLLFIYWLIFKFEIVALKCFCEFDQKISGLSPKIMEIFNFFKKIYSKLSLLICPFAYHCVLYHWFGIIIMYYLCIIIQSSSRN